MKNIKSYQDFTNEEINWKNAVIGGAVAATGLMGCNVPPDYTSQQTPSEITQQPVKELPNSFTMKEKLITIGTDMYIRSNDNEYLGIIEQRTISLANKYEYFDNNKELVASAREKVLSLYTIIDITDGNGQKIGSIEQELIESLFSIYSIYSIKDKDGNVIAKSKKLDLFTTNVDIEDNMGGKIKIHKTMISIGAKWDINIDSEIDKKLIIFIPSFITASQSKQKSD